MSSITQVRLAPITHRYMSMSFRRQDWNERSASQAIADIMPATTRLEQSCQNDAFITSALSRFRSAKYLDFKFNSRERRSYKRSSRYQESRTSELAAIRESSNRKDYLHFGRGVIREQDYKLLDDSCKYRNFTYPSHRSELSSMNDYSSKISQRIDFKFNVDEALTISKTTTCLQGSRTNRSSKNKRSESGQSESDRQRKCNKKPFYLTLAFMGLFGRPTESEIEEGKVQLSDEQKIKKMKPVELKIARGVLSMCDQEYGRANQLFHEALHIAQDEGDEERENLIFNLIAANYFESGDLENAEKLFIDIMKRMIAHDVAPTAPPILELSLKLASIYSKNPATHEKALKGFKFVINSLLYNLEEVVNRIEELDMQSLTDEKKNELALLGWGYDWFAKHLLLVNDYGGAADMLQRAVQISSLVLGPLHDQTLILLNDIGTTLAMNDSPEEGKIFIRKAVQGAIASQSKELASFYVNLGLVNLKLMKLDEAKRYCEYSLELAKKNRDHYNTQEVIELSQTCLNEVRRLLDAEGQ